jgi:hypothetical protein
MVWRLNHLFELSVADASEVCHTVWDKRGLLRAATLRRDTESQKDNQNDITQQHHLVSVADMVLTKKATQYRYV